MKLAGATLVLAALGLWVCAQPPAPAEQIYRDGFEGKDPLWVRDSADAAFQEKVHRNTDEFANTGRHSEQIEVQAENGSYIYYYYDTPHAVIADDTQAGIHVKATRPGLVLLARVVLPHEHNANNTQEAAAIVLQSDPSDVVGHWQKLQLRNPKKMLADQQGRVQIDTKKALDISDAYIDRLILNVYTGPGLADVWIDDLEIGPVSSKAPFRTTNRAVDSVPPTVDSAPLDVKLENQLIVGGNRFLMRAIRHTDTPLDVLEAAGFNTVYLNEASTPELIAEAARLKLRVMAPLPVYEADGKQMVSTATLQDRIRAFTQPADPVLVWLLGQGSLTAEQHDAVEAVVKNCRTSDPRPIPTSVVAWDGLKAYTTATVDMLGVYRWPLMTSLELSQYRVWLNQRRALAEPQAFMWTWIQNHLPDWYTRLVYDQSATTPFTEPIGPQPEQIRLMSYLALAAGYRGLGFWSDRFLAQSHQGHDRMLELALINQELQLLEPLLTSTQAAPQWLETSDARVRAAIFHGDRGTLVLPIWMGAGSQYVTGQGAAINVSITVPAPDSSEAWLVSPGDVHSMYVERVLGGKKITLPEFGLTAAIVLTSDNGPNGLLIYFQNKVSQMRKQAAQWSMTLAQKELEKVTTVETELNQQGHTARNEDQLLRNCRERLEKCQQHWADREYRECYLEAQIAVRPLRIIMRSQWEEAVKGLTTPTASPYALSYYTLPRHWQFMDQQVKKTVPGTNVLANGDFELPTTQSQPGWVLQSPPPLDDVALSAERVTTDYHEGKQCLKLEAKPKNPEMVIGALDRTFVAVHSPEVALQPGTLVQISGWMKVPKPILASVDGAMFYDSAGDSPLGVRLTSCPAWKQFVFYRKVPASGKIRVSLALTGIGIAYFDDVRIQPCGLK